MRSKLSQAVKGGATAYFKNKQDFPEGKLRVLRILPAPQNVLSKDPEAEFFKLRLQHWIGAKGSGKFYPCPRSFGKKYCPLCSKFFELKKDDELKNVQLPGGPSKSYTMNAAIIDKKTGKLGQHKILSLGQRGAEALGTLLDRDFEEETGGLFWGDDLGAKGVRYDLKARFVGDGKWVFSPTKKFRDLITPKGVLENLHDLDGMREVEEDELEKIADAIFSKYNTLFVPKNKKAKHEAILGASDDDEDEDVEEDDDDEETIVSEAVEDDEDEDEELDDADEDDDEEQDDDDDEDVEADDDEDEDDDLEDDIDEDEDDEDADVEEDDDDEEEEAPPPPVVKPKKKLTKKAKKNDPKAVTEALKSGKKKRKSA